MPSLPDVKKILKRLDALYPDPQISIQYSNPLENLVATLLSAQCRDERVNQVTPALFKKYKNADDYRKANLKTLEQEIKSTGFFRNKALSIKKCCTRLVEEFCGKVPSNLDALVKLPGVGRKTANAVLVGSFKIPGIIVDTHVKRVSYRLGLTKNTDPEKIEFDLMKIVPKKRWARFSQQLIHHGRKICKAARPLCKQCGLENLCLKVGVEKREGRREKEEGRRKK